MSRDIEEFLRTYTRALEESTAAIFAGAGLSKPAGYVNWKELLKDIASEIGLDVDKETDLVEVAQYHVNENGGNRARINQTLIDEFTKETDITENHRILARLPIKTYWTTNYDKLIEDSLKAAHKRSDNKITQENLAITMPNSDATIFKMHGDISHPNDAVLTKDDYESYNNKRSLFTTSLRGDLVSKTFLFIGFSFDDPNLEYILSRIRVLLGENQRPHYCFMKKVQMGKEYSNKEDFLYAEIKQRLKINDLKRFNIKVLLVNEYNEITEILKVLEDRSKRKNIFISGSASDYGAWGEKRTFEFASRLSKKVINSDNNIVTGFGLGIGSCILSGALEEIYKIKNKRVEERLISRPFPQHTVGQNSIKELWTIHRRDMIENVGISIFIFGNKFKNNVIVDADGMEEEFAISLENKSIPIPVGVTGYTAKKLWDLIMNDFANYVPYPELEIDYKAIGNYQLSDEEVIDHVINIINKLKKKIV
ncbi:SIR2 family protein [Lysinibacillus fusiformis]|uniref:SIR2 family protein n=1 Tax=Lysinibacillus fusiformis TaxID=28031 RepID=UPI001EF430AC|nr:SIR2 family protein [Lysinibacillus fusiformis]MCG7435584.1 SIR2 family protein [Lysinibacillus fusiformis]